MLHEVYSRSSREREYYDNVGHYNIFSVYLFCTYPCEDSKIIIRRLFVFAHHAGQFYYHLRPKLITLNEPHSVSLSKNEPFLYLYNISVK